MVLPLINPTNRRWEKLGNRLTRPCKGDEFEIRFLRLKDKMLVFAGLVKKGGWYRHSFRLAGVWLKTKKRFACAVMRFLCSRAFYDFWSFASCPANLHWSSFVSSSRRLIATGQRASLMRLFATRRHYDAMSNCTLKCLVMNQCLRHNSVSIEHTFIYTIKVQEVV